MAEGGDATTDYTVAVCESLARMLASHEPFIPGRRPVQVMVRPGATGVDIEATFALEGTPKVRIGYRFTPDGDGDTDDEPWTPPALAGLLFDEIAEDLDGGRDFPPAGDSGVHWVNG